MKQDFEAVIGSIIGVFVAGGLGYFLLVVLIISLIEMMLAFGSDGKYSIYIGFFEILGSIWGIVLFVIFGLVAVAREFYKPGGMLRDLFR